VRQSALLEKLISPKYCAKIIPLTENSRAASFRYIKTQRATDIGVCKTVHRFRITDKEAVTSTILTTKAPLITNMEIDTYVYQVSAVVYMLGDLFGRFPL
jgi:hypothetical protein